MDVMLDLETMGNTPNSAIIAIGAVKFNKDGVHDHFQRHVSLESSIEAGLEANASTILWWLDQSDDARKKITTSEAFHLNQALADFAEFVNCGKFSGKVWGNGAAFDNVILGNAYDKTKKKRPWAFWNDRCYRTMKSLHPNIPLPERVGVFHNAVDDAWTQALHLIEIMKAPKLW